MTGSVKYTVNPGPQAVVGISEKHSDLTHFDFAQTPVILPPRASRARRSLLLRTFVENQNTAILEARQVSKFAADFTQHILRLPGRMRHEVLNVLLTGSCRAGQIAEIPFGRHTQQPTQDIQGILAGSAKRSRNATSRVPNNLTSPGGKPQALDGCVSVFFFINRT